MTPWMPRIRWIYLWLASHASDRLHHCATQSFRVCIMPYRKRDSNVKIVLHVEDDPVVLDSMRMMLMAHDYDVISVADGEAALRAVEFDGVTPDLLIVDFHLGHGMNGTDVAERITRALKYPMPVVLLTGDAANAYVPWITKAPVWLLPKPVDARLFAAAVGPLTDFTRVVRPLAIPTGHSNDTARPPI